MVGGNIIDEDFLFINNSYQPTTDKGAKLLVNLHIAKLPFLGWHTTELAHLLNTCFV
jgi:hypothetical protein